MPEVLVDLPTRIATAAATVRDAATSHRLAVQTRDELIVQAVDEGVPQRAIAAAAGFKSAAHITTILGKAHAVD
jgi:hypothetical protein